MARVLFVQLSSFELNGFAILSAVLKNNGHETDVFSLALDSYRCLEKLVEFWKPDIIGFTVTSFDYGAILALAKQMRGGCF